MLLGSVMLDIDGTELSAEDRELLKHPAVGGVILFARHYRDPQQLSELTVSIRALRNPPLLIAVDQEGGRVQRFKHGFKRLPPAGYYGALYRQSPALACQAAHTMGWLMASELRSVGVDYSFAPVLDIERGLCQVIGDRAFGDNASQVIDLASNWMKGARSAGMVSVGKHFPGHGGVSIDSHLALPRDERSFETLFSEDMAPFQALIQQGLEAVMPAHVVYSAIDDVPAGFSHRWLQDILRGRLGFQGAIISDSLDMAAAAVIGNAVDRAKAALAAGCDQLLVCNNRAAAIQIVDALTDCPNPAAQSRLARLYPRHLSPLPDETLLLQAEKWLEVFEFTDNIELTADPTTHE